MNTNSDEYDRFCLAVYGLLPLQTTFVNKWYSRIIYELVHNPDAFSLDDIEHIAAYNNKYISTRFIDRSKILTDDTIPNGFDIAHDYLQHDILMKIVELGRLFRTDSPGFNDSELYYLTAGMAYINVLNKAPTDYTTIVKEIARIIQINPLNIVINANCSMTDSHACPNSMGRWSLVTHIKSDGNDNYRYMPALKYFDGYVRKEGALTDFNQIDKDKTIRIETSYNKSRLEEVNKELSSMVERLMDKYKNDDTDELYIKDCIDIYTKFIDTQQYTRGTCIIGQIMLSYLMFYRQWIKHKQISVYASNPNELPDWAACAGKCDESLFHTVQFCDSINGQRLTNIINDVPVKTTTVLFQYRALINSYQ